MSGFSIGDVFGKTFLSAETIIGGRRTFGSENKQTFNASLVGFNTSSATFKSILENGIENKNIGHTFVKKGSSQKYVGNPSFVDWDNDRIKLTGGGDYGVEVEGNNNSILKFKIQAQKPLGGDDHVSPTTKKDGSTITLVTAAGRSDFPSIQPGDNNNEVIVTLSKSGEYIGLDPGADASGIGTFTVKVDGHTFSRDNSKDARISLKGATPVYLSLISWELQIRGCMDPTATNYNPKANRERSCTYTVAPISSFTTSVSESTQGVSKTTTFAWALDTGTDSAPKRATSVKLYVSNSAGSNQLIKEWGSGIVAQNYTYNLQNLPVGTNTFKLVSAWDKNSGTTKSETVSIKINSPATLLTCQDPNASKYGETSETGDCGPCNSGYSKKNGKCAKEGCTTDDDYNFDPEAVVHNESMCGGTPTTEQDPPVDESDPRVDESITEETPDADLTGRVPETSDETGAITTGGDAISAQIEPEESGLGKWILPGIGVLAVGAIILMR